MAVVQPTDALSRSASINPLQSDYKRHPKRRRGTAAQVAKWARETREGEYDLRSDETFWRDIHSYLVERSYTLRPRFRPGWTPSWLGTDINPDDCEDSLQTMVRNLPMLEREIDWASKLPWVMDARRPDNSVVAIKWIPDAEHTQHELEVMRFLSSDDLRKDPRNRAVPLLDSFPHPTIPDGVFIVMPWLGNLTDIPVEFVNELVDLMLQTFDARRLIPFDERALTEPQGLAFLHEHGVAHRYVIILTTVVNLY